MNKEPDFTAMRNGIVAAIGLAILLWAIVILIIM